MKLRKITEEDRSKIDEFIAKDKFHAGKGSSDFFFEPFSEGLIFEDDAGNVAYFRIARALRVNAAFDVDARESNKEFIKAATLLFSENARKSGIREVVYTSANPALRRFGETLGFEEQPTLVMAVEPTAQADSSSSRE